MTGPLAPIVIRSLDDLLDAFRARKDELRLSNETVDRLAGIASGHCDKTLGPSQKRKLTRLTFDLFLDVLALEIHVVPNLDAARVMEKRWEGRIGNYRAKDYRHVPNRIGKRIIEQAKPLLMAELGKLGAQKLNGMRTAAHRSESARNAAQSRWRALRKRKREAGRRTTQITDACSG